ncbi:MAG: universal stress protein [Chloroflexota bacterium]
MSRVALVPLDGSALGEAALASAALLAREHDLTLMLLRVVPFPTVFAGDTMGSFSSPEIYADIVRMEHEDAAAYLDTTQKRLAADGLDVQTLLRDGPPAEHILDVADEFGVRFIALATHGRSGLARLALGSTTEHVVQHASVPILLVRIQHETTARVPALRKVLVPLDGSPLAERALDIAADVTSPGADVVLMSSLSPRMMAVGSGTAITAVTDDAETKRAVREADEYLNNVVARNAARGWSLSTQVRVGEPAEQILEAAREHDVDVVVLTTHGHTGPARWLLGSIADQVVRGSRRPVVLASVRALAARAAGDVSIGAIMTRDVTTVRDDDSLMSAIRKLLRHGISGAPVVNGAGDLVGILSEYNVLEWRRQLAEKPPEERPLSPDEYAWRLANVRVREVMTQPAHAVEDSVVLSVALEEFQERRVRPLPVTHMGRLVGVVRRADVLKAMVSHWQLSDEETPPSSE